MGGQGTEPHCIPSHRFRVTASPPPIEIKGECSVNFKDGSVLPKQEGQKSCHWAPDISHGKHSVNCNTVGEGPTGGDGLNNEMSSSERTNRKRPPQEDNRSSWNVDLSFFQPDSPR